VSSLLNTRKVRAPAVGKCGVGYVTFNGANGDRTKFIIECARAFTKAVLRADTATYFRQAIGLVGQLGSFHDAAFTRKLEPVRYVVMHRALPLAVRVAASDATLCLCLTLRLLKGIIDFTKLMPA